MPLQLGGIETLRPQTIVWDPERHEEYQDAIKTIAGLVNQGFTYVEDRTDIGYVKMIPPEKDPNLGVFRILSENGDDRIVWDRTILSQVKEAFKKFQEFVEKGYTAYATANDGSRGHKIDTFDPGLSEVILLQNSEIILVPKTVPG